MLGLRRTTALLLSVALAIGLATSQVSAASAKTRKSRDVDEDAERTHVVAPGQTLAKLAKRYHVTVEELRDANDIRPGERIHEGTRLVIPTHDEDRARARKGGKGKDVEASYDRKDRDADRDRDTDDDKSSSRKKDKRDRKAKTDRDDAESRSGAVERLGRRGEGVTKAGHVRLVRGSEVWEGKLLDKKGKIAPRTMEGFTRLLAPNTGNKRHSIDPRLVTLVGMVSDHFHGRTIEVVSGFRPATPDQYTAHSRHNGGFAIDFHVRGVPNEEVRDYCKTFRETGVGFYPNSSFVHLDVRDVSTSWVDFSKPGEAPRYHHPEQAKDADETTGEVMGTPTAAADTKRPATDGKASTETKPATDAAVEGGSSTTPVSDAPRPTENAKKPAL